MDPSLILALKADGPVVASLVRIDLPGEAIRLTDGGFVDYADDPTTPGALARYVGEHPTYGVLASISSVRSGAEASSSRIEIGLHPATDVGLSTLASPLAQGARVRWWEGAIDRVTGQLIGEPDLQFDGELDRGRLGVGSGRALTLACGSASERQLEPNADWRLNDAFHQRIWPGELGLAHITNVLKKSEWRERPPSPGLFKRIGSALSLGLIK